MTSGHKEKKEKSTLKGGERSIFLGRWRSDLKALNGEVHLWEKGGKKKGTEGFLKSEGEGFCVVEGDEGVELGWPFLFLCYQKEVGFFF